MTHRSASRCVYLLVPASRIILFVNFVIPVVEGLGSSFALFRSVVSIPDLATAAPEKGRYAR